MSDSSQPSRNLVFKAGLSALQSIRRDGFAAERIGTIAGASGGAKWLVLSQLDRYVLAHLVPKLVGPVHLLGSSIGAWRFACYAQADPVAAIDRFEQAYISQSYSDKPDMHEISAKMREILAIVMPDGAAEEILSHPVFRTHVMTVRARHLAASDNRLLLGSALIAAAAMNVISRRTLGWFFERALFFDARDLPPCFDVAGFPLQKIRIRTGNIRDAITATGAIPMVLSGVPDIEGAMPGTYRDGGVIDYHLDVPLSDTGRLTLFLHFFDRLVPGWFDKNLSWRRPAPENVENTILISPSAEFVARLPRGKIPDRTDFASYASLDRIRAWQEVVTACAALVDELHEVIETDQLAARLQPL
ncbi:MAG: patatin-like phospholipase family protein [Gammaproteobacteria bacterium]|nr:patatin-like phospholipase family protein [Gammaproteobacteria bacterium]